LSLLLLLLLLSSDLLSFVLFVRAAVLLLFSRGAAFVWVLGPFGGFFVGVVRLCA
jgi:hypothetical protein